MNAIKNHVLFQFVDEIVRKSDFGKERTQFKDSTDWGFTVSSYDEGVQQPRWGIVTAIGPNVEPDFGLKVGSKILVEALKWSDAFYHDGERYWRTDSSWVLGVDEAA